MSRSRVGLSFSARQWMVEADGETYPTNLRILGRGTLDMKEEKKKEIKLINNSIYGPRLYLFHHHGSGSAVDAYYSKFQPLATGAAFGPFTRTISAAFRQNVKILIHLSHYLTSDPR